MKRRFFGGKRGWFIISAALAILLSGCVAAEIDDDDFYLPVGEQHITPGENAESVIEYLGAYNTLYRSPACGYEGEDKIYSYGGFDIYTVSDSGGEKIRKIVLKSDEYCTEKGLRVGDAREKVIAAYGEGREAREDVTEYKKGDCVLQFSFRDGVVTAIRYFVDED